MYVYDDMCYNPLLDHDRRTYYNFLNLASLGVSYSKLQLKYQPKGVIKNPAEFFFFKQNKSHIE